MISKNETMKKNMTAMRLGLLAVGLAALVLMLLSGASQVGAANGAFIESNGLVVVEFESNPPVGDWSLRKWNAGYTGSGFYTWKHGSTNQGTDGSGNGILEYPVRITNPGRYRIEIRSASPEGFNTEHNDVWIRSLDADATAIDPDDGNIVKLNRNWWKSYQNEKSTDWVWQTRHVDHNPHEVFFDFPSAGVYRVQFSGRSSMYMIDRFVLYNNNWSSDAATQSNLPESPREGGNSTPPPPPPPTPTPPPPPPTLPDTLQNNGFESGGTVNRLAADWNVQNALKGTRRRCDVPRLNKYFARSGECAFRFAGAPGVNSRIAQRLSGDGIDSGDTLALSAYVSGSNLSTGGRIVLVVAYSDGTPRSRSIIEVPTGTYDYQQVSTSLNVTSSNISRVVVRLALKNGSGRYLVDDLNLTLNGASMVASTASELLPLPQPGS